MTQQGIQHTLLNTKSQIQTNLWIALKELWIMQTQHKILRSQSLQTKSTILINQRNAPKAKIFHNINKSEKSQSIYQIFDRMCKKHGVQQQLDQVETSTSWPAAYTEIESLSQLEDPKHVTTGPQ